MAIKFSDNHSLSFFAKLLSNENINVIFDDVPTAAYHIQTKTVILPFFKNEVPEETKLHLASHEVAHFLFSPSYVSEVTENNRSAAILNIIEDCRIEKLIQEKYPNLSYFYKKSYQYINKIGWFEGQGTFVAGDNFIPAPQLEEQPLIYRLNKHLCLNIRGKMNFDVKFYPNEEYAVKLCEKVKTWEDVLVAHDEILKLHKQEMEEHPERFPGGDPTSNYKNTNTSDMNSEVFEEISLEEFIQKIKEGKITPESIVLIKTKNNKKNNSKKSKTPNNSKIKKSKSKGEEHENFDINEVIKLLSKDNNIPQGNYKVSFNYLEKDHLIANNKIRAEKSYLYTEKVSELITSQQKSVSDMVRLFLRLKNANLRKLEKKSDSGYINNEKIAFYRTDENIFNSNLKKPRQKNHGFVMFIDFSGSMTNSLPTVGNQVIRLVEFCNRLSIPFRVYGFTNTHTFGDTPQKMGVLAPTDGLRIYELMKEKQGNKIQTYSKFFSIMDSNSSVGFNGTPLYSSMLLVPELISNFISETKVEKVNFFVFTDGGDTDGLRYNNNKIESIGNSSINFDKYVVYSDTKASSYFDELNIFYNMFKRIFDVNVTTIYMDSYIDQSLFEEKNQSNIDSDNFFMTKKWGDTFYAITPKFLEKPENDGFFIKTLMIEMLK